MKVSAPSEGAVVGYGCMTIESQSGLGSLLKRRAFFSSWCAMPEAYAVVLNWIKRTGCLGAS